MNKKYGKNDTVGKFGGVDLLFLHVKLFQN